MRVLDYIAVVLTDTSRVDVQVQFLVKAFHSNQITHRPRSMLTEFGIVPGNALAEGGCLAKLAFKLTVELCVYLQYVVLS